MSKEAPKSADNNDPGNKSDKSNEIRNLSQNSASSSIHQSHDSSDNRSGSSTTKHANEIAGHNVINNANTPSNTSKQSELTTEKKVQPAEENNLGDSVFSKHTSKSADRVRKKSQDKRLSEKKAPSTDKNDPSKPSKRNSAHVELLPQHQTVSAPPTSTKSSFLFGLLKRSKKENKGDKSSQHKRKNNAKNGKGTAEGSTPHDHHRTAEGSTPHDHHRTAKMNDDRTRAVPSKEVKKLPNKNEKKQKEQKKQSPRLQQRQHIVANCLAELSDDLQDKIKKAKLPEDKVNANFRILLNILHFLTKDSYRMDDNVPTPPRAHYRRPYASAKLIEEAKRIARSPDKSIKKLFKHIEFSGKGGFGRVFGAKDTTTKRHVAIKKLPHVTERDKRNNWCEIGFLATCKHPNIVRFLGAWEMTDEVWIVMEFLEGGTLHEAIKVHQFCERHIAYIAREVLKALDFLHSNKFVHRDLKSANVMMSIDGEIKLIDFGLCADISEGERIQMVGSPFWMPPEMIRREPHGCPADIWSFAVCLLEMYLREPPNASSRLRAMFIAATDGLKDSIPAHASPEAKDFLSHCLELDPKKRATAAELLKHPFVQGPRLSDGIKDVLRGIFISQSLALSGI